jgi:hypothetical protein
MITSAIATTDGSRVNYLGTEVGEGACGDSHETAMFQRIMTNGSTAIFIGRNSCPHCAAHALQLAAFIREGDIRSLAQQGYQPAPSQAAEFAAAIYGA